MAIMLPLYEEVKLATAKHMNKGIDQLNVYELSFSTAVAKTVASSLTYPHEVVRSRMQLSGRFSSIIPTCREVSMIMICNKVKGF